MFFRKIKLFLSLLLSLLLFGCAPQQDKIENLAEVYYQKDITATVDIVANSGLMAEYSLTYSRTDGQGQVVITSPKQLEGISAQMSEQSATVSFDGVSVDMLLPQISGFSPVDALDRLLYDIESIMPSEYTEKDQMLALTYLPVLENHSGEKRVFLDAQTFAPISAEFVLDGAVVMSMEITSFQIY